MASRFVLASRRRLLAQALDPFTPTDALEKLMGEGLSDRRKMPEDVGALAFAREMLTERPDLGDFYQPNDVAEIVAALAGQPVWLAGAANPSLPMEVTLSAGLVDRIAWYHSQLYLTKNLPLAFLLLRMFWRHNPIAGQNLDLLLSEETILVSVPVSAGKMRDNSRPGIDMLNLIYGDCLDQLGVIEATYQELSSEPVTTSQRDRNVTLLSDLIEILCEKSRDNARSDRSHSVQTRHSVLRMLENFKNFKTSRDDDPRWMTRWVWGALLRVEYVSPSPSLEAIVEVFAVLERFRLDHKLPPFTHLLDRVL